MKKNVRKRIIITHKFKNHMKIHKNSFIVPYTKLIDTCIRNGTFQYLAKPFEVLTVKFPYSIGFSKMAEVTEADYVFYAKRIGRDIFTKFVKGKEHKEINKCIICLKQNQENSNEYFLITMFPGEHMVKEPEDSTISDIPALEATLKFWEHHALIFEEDTVDTSTIVEECPYNFLWDKVK